VQGGSGRKGEGRSQAQVVTWHMHG
jgi:hypothetical protein